MTSAMPRVTINLNKLRFPIHTFFLWKFVKKF